MKKNLRIFGLMAVIVLIVSACTDVKRVNHVFVSNGATITKLSFGLEQIISGHLPNGEPVYVNYYERMLSEDQRPVSSIEEYPGMFPEIIRKNCPSYQAIYSVNSKNAEEISSVYVVTWHDIIHYSIKGGVLKSEKLDAKDAIFLPRALVRAFRKGQGFYVI